MMRYLLVIIALLTLAVMGCGDDGDTGTSAGEACGGADCVDDPDKKAGCEFEFNKCIDQGQSVTSCVIAAVNICGEVEIP